MFSELGGESLEPDESVGVHRFWMIHESCSLGEASVYEEGSEE